MISHHFTLRRLHFSILRAFQPAYLRQPRRHGFRRRRAAITPPFAVSFTRRRHFAAITTDEATISMPHLRDAIMPMPFYATPLIDEADDYAITPPNSRDRANTPPFLRHADGLIYCTPLRQRHATPTPPYLRR
jgi:hypothetical protein